MLIHVAGSDSFLAKRAIDQIKQKYLAKNPLGAELLEIGFDTPNPNWADLQAVPLFATSRLVIIREAAKFSASDQDNLAHFLTNHPDTTVVVVWDAKIAKAGSVLANALAGSRKTIQVEPLVGPALIRWVKSRASELELALPTEIIANLSNNFGSDLWAIENELQTLRNDPEATVGGAKKNADVPFAVFGFVRVNNWEAVKKNLADDLNLGKPLELILGGLAAAVRKETRSSETKQAVTDLLMDIDIGIKTGLLDDRAAIALIISHLPNPAPGRVQWEDTWEETYLLT